MRRVSKLRVDEALKVAVQLHRQGHLTDAEELYRNALDAVPEHPDALHYLGVLAHQMGATEKAVGLIRRALELVPDHADAHNNLGNILKEAGRSSEAEAAYRRAIALAPGCADPHNNLGVVLRNQGRLEEAVAEYEAAIQIAPDHADAHHNLAGALKGQGRFDEAIHAARRAIALKPDKSQSFRNLADALYRAGRRDEAMAVLEQWLAYMPDHPVAKHQLAAYRGEGAVPERAPDDYVREIFDDFAPSYELALGLLEYRGPTLVAEALAAELPSPGGTLDVLDAGCGTGLCGPFLRRYARRLVGVDLSAAMIARARHRGDYDELVTSELVAFLSGGRMEFDIIASADTLIYIGDLGPFFTAAHDRMRPGGRLVFTVEHAADLDPDNDYRLDPSGRYSHSKPYVLRALAESGWVLATLRDAILRKELNRPVPGLVVAARKQPAGAS